MPSSIVEYHGRIIKRMGDGVLVEFRSVVDAVESALAMQRGMAEHDDELLDDRRISIALPPRIMPRPGAKSAALMRL
jgi:adenylate cyclase